MGGSDFYTYGTGTTAKEAFKSAVSEAQYEYGHRGYTGSLAEKESFIMIPAGSASPDELAEKLMDECDDRICDKWGPAGCIDAGDGRYLFFGSASS
jgi:hypothetical protein